MSLTQVSALARSRHGADAASARHEPPLYVFGPRTRWQRARVRVQPHVWASQHLICGRGAQDASAHRHGRKELRADLGRGYMARQDTGGVASQRYETVYRRFGAARLRRKSDAGAAGMEGVQYGACCAKQSYRPLPGFWLRLLRLNRRCPGWLPPPTAQPNVPETHSIAHAGHAHDLSQRSSFLPRHTSRD